MGYKPNINFVVKDETPFDDGEDKIKILKTDIPYDPDKEKNTMITGIVDYHKHEEEKYRNSFKFNFTRPDKPNSNKFTDSESTKDIFQELIDKNTKNQK